MADTIERRGTRDRGPRITRIYFDGASTVSEQWVHDRTVSRWREKGISYSLVSLPLDLTFGLDYSDPSSEVYFVMTPMGDNKWLLDGDVDRQIITNFAHDID